MRKIDAMAAWAGLIACLVLARPNPTAPDELAADAWMLEHGVEVALSDLSDTYEACYAATLPPAGATDGRARMVLASNCGGDPIAQLT